MNRQRHKKQLLFERARRGDIEGVKRLIRKGNVHVDTTNRCNKQTALYVACENGHTELAKYLLEHGASVKLGANPLIVAVRNNNYGCVQLLLEHNADAKFESPLSVALQKRHYSVILLLLRHLDHDAILSESIRDVAVQLLKHAKVEDSETIQKLIDANIINLTSDDTFLAAFDFAFQRGSVEIAEAILSHDSYSKNEQLPPEAVYYSGKNNWPNMLSRLLEKGVDINASTHGQTPLYVACEEGHESIIKLLLNNGADPNVPNKSTASKGETALYLACKREQLDDVQMLLEAGADVTEDSNQFCPLIAACEADNIQLINLLFKAGADVKCRKKNDTTCLGAVIMAYSLNNPPAKSLGLDSERGLYRASNAGHEPVVRLLLETGAKTSGATGYFSLCTACEHGYTEIVDLLLQHGANPNASMSIFTDEAIDNIPTSWRSMPGIETLPIRRAMSKGYSDIVNLLLDYGADVNKQDLSGKSALIYFIELMASRMCTTSQLSNERDFEILKSTLVAGGDVNMLSQSDGLNALQIASSFGIDDLMSELINHGADCNKLTSSRKSPLHLACERCHGLAKQLFPEGAEPDGKTSAKSSNCSGYSIADFNPFAMLPHFTTSHVTSHRPEGAVDKHPKHTACNGQHYSPDAVKLLLEHKADVNIRDGDGKTVLHHALESVSCSDAAACETKTLDLVDMLLKHGADPDMVWKRTPSSRVRLPLLVSCIIGHVSLVRLLLKYNANVDAADVDGNTALHHAIELHCQTPLRSTYSIPGVSSSNAKPLVDILMENKADVNVANSDGETSLYRAASRGLQEVVRKMLEVYGGNPNKGSPDKSPLVAACVMKNVELVDILLKHGADPNLAWDSCEPDSRIRLPLFIAVDKGNSDILRSLLNAGADVNALDHEGKSPLVAACKAKSVELVHVLLTHAADPNLTCCEPGSRIRLPLLVACKIGHVSLVELLLQCNANVDVADVDGNTALHHAIERHDQTPLQSTYSIPGLSSSNTKPLVDILMENKADVNIENRDGETALYRAASGGLIDVVRKMLEVYGGNPNKGSLGKSPLVAACVMKNVELVDILLKHGADPNMAWESCEPDSIRSRLPLFVAVKKGNSDILRSLLNAGADVNAVDHEGKSLLVAASEAKSVELVDVLLKYGADPNLAWKSCETGSMSRLPLFIAVDKGNIDIVRSLLNAGADVNAVDHEGKSIACFAAECVIRSEDDGLLLIRLLLQCGANFSTRMPDGHSPVQLAVIALRVAQRCVHILYPSIQQRSTECVIELLQLMIKHGAVLDDSSCLPANISNLSLNSNILKALATFDGRHEFIVDLFRAGAGFQLIAHCCDVLRTTYDWQVKSIGLCQAIVLAGYSPSDEDVHELQLAADRDNTSDSLTKQLANWLNKDRQQVPSLLRQCRVVIRRQLSVAAHFQTILSSSDRLPLPTILKQYLEFDEKLSEIDFSVSKELQTGRQTGRPDIGLGLRLFARSDTSVPQRSYDLDLERHFWSSLTIRQPTSTHHTSLSTQYLRSYDFFDCWLDRPELITPEPRIIKKTYCELEGWQAPKARGFERRKREGRAPKARASKRPRRRRRAGMGGCGRGRF